LIGLRCAGATTGPTPVGAFGAELKPDPHAAVVSASSIRAINVLIDAYPFSYGLLGLRSIAAPERMRDPLWMLNPLELAEEEAEELDVFATRY
jgi:hypothetical protein